MKPTDTWGKWSRLFSLVLLFSIVAFGVIGIAAGQQSEANANDAYPSWIGYALTALLVIGAGAALGYIFSKFASFIEKRRTPDGKARPVGWRAHKKLLFVGGAALILSVLFFIGSQPETCQDAACFIAAAKDGKSARFHQTDETNTEWNYQISRGSSGNLVFVKILVRLDDEEMPHIKDLLEGKSLTCELSGNFDERLVTTLFYGIDGTCSGELKENLGRLLLLVDAQ